MLEDLQQMAKAIDGKYRQSIAELAQDDTLSPQGKVERAQQLDGQRRSRVAALQAQAQRRLDSARQQAQLDAQAAKAAEIDAKRQLLGDSVLADIYRRRIERLDGDGIAQMFQNAANGWEAAIVREYGLLVLEARTSTPGATRQDFSAMMELRQSGDSAQDDGIQQAETIAGMLDLAAYRQSMANRLNVSAEFVPDPF